LPGGQRSVQDCFDCFAVSFGEQMKYLFPFLLVAACTLILAGCGTHTLDLPPDTPASIRHGGELFIARCATCHTLDIAGTRGSAISPKSQQYKNGPKFNVRKETVPRVLYAIRNGGFSSSPMPQNIVVGPDAQDVAEFVAKYSGSKVPKIPTP
jgi:mono/diheme cytochrome c family protein